MQLYQTPSWRNLPLQLKVQHHVLKTWLCWVGPVKNRIEGIIPCGGAVGGVLLKEYYQGIIQIVLKLNQRLHIEFLRFSTQVILEQREVKIMNLLQIFHRCLNICVKRKKVTSASPSFLSKRSRRRSFFSA